MDKTFNVEEKCHSSDVLARLDQFRKNQQYCDFTIKCGIKEIPVHKCLVAASSEYFNAMLSNDIKENMSGVVELEEVDPESVAKCVDFMYTGKAVVSERKHVEIVIVASLLQLQKFCDLIVNCMKASMDPNSFFTARKVAIKYGLDKLTEACGEFAVDNFCAIMKMGEFQHLEAEYLESLLCSPELNILDDVKCKALMAWVNNDSNRVTSLFNLMKVMDISKVQILYRKFLLDDPIIFNSPQCLEYIMRSMPDENVVHAADYSGDCNPAIMIVKHFSHKIECFDLEKKIWSDMHDLKINAEFTCMVVVDIYLYVISRKPALFRLNFMERDATWEKLSSPPQCYDGPVVVLNGLLYVFDFSSDDCSRLGQYDLVKDCWSQTEPDRWSILCEESCMTAAHGKVIVVGIGGRSYNDYGDFDSLVPSEAEYFDPITSAWSFVESLHEARYGASACTHKNAIYVFGGWDQYTHDYFESVEILYSLDSHWELVKLSYFSRAEFQSYSFHGKIYLVGGGDTVDVFDPKDLSEFEVIHSFGFDGVHFLSAMVTI